MKHIGILSDTHSYLDNKVFRHFDACDEVWHAGDIGNVEVADKLAAFKPLRAVYGNIDGADLRISYPEEQFFECEGQRVYMIHIGGSPGKYPAAVKSRLLELQPTLYVCGHSHILRIVSDKGYGNMLHVNPGAAGVHGFHQVRTLVRLKIDEGRIFDVQVIELGKRSLLSNK